MLVKCILLSLKHFMIDTLANPQYYTPKKKQLRCALYDASADAYYQLEFDDSYYLDICTYNVNKSIK